MDKMALFSDASLNPTLNTGFGSYVLVPQRHIEEQSYEVIRENVKIKRFETSSSTELEMLTLLWALEECEKIFNVSDVCSNLTIYTDSQCIAGLPRRREKLERSEFTSRACNRALNNAPLYRRFYSYSDNIGFDVIKLKGHSKSVTKDALHKIFSYVDKASRKALRMYMGKNSIRTKNTPT